MHSSPSLIWIQKAIILYSFIHDFQEMPISPVLQFIDASDFIDIIFINPYIVRKASPKTVTLELD